MTGPQADEAVQQAFFGWSYELKAHTLLVSSFDVSLQARWRTRLQDFVRLQPVGMIAPPDVALSCLEFDDGSVAVVRRINHGYSSGRGNAHVLIGTTATLDPSLALRLAQWEGWKESPPPGTLGTFAPSWLVDGAGPAQLAPAVVAPLERQLTMVVARLLTQPRMPLSIIGCAEQDRLPMVWAIRAAAEEYLARAFEVRRRWTFSTYEERHGAGIENLPEIVFLPALPSTGEPHQRNVVRLDAPPAEDARTTDLARQLVAGLLHNAPAPELPVAEPVRELPPAQQHTAVPEQARYRPTEPVAHQRSVRRQPPNAREVLVEPLLAAKSVEDFLTELERLARHHDRAQLRAAFDLDSVNEAAERVEIDTRRTVLTRLLWALFGQDFKELQSPSGKAYAAQLVRSCRSDELSRLLGAIAAKRGVEEVAGAAYDRWAQLGGPLLQVPRRRVAPLPWVRTRRRRVLAVVAGVVVLLALVFAGGYLTGLPSAAQPTTVPPAGQTTVVPTTPQQPARKSGTAQVSANPAQQEVFAFMMTGGLYYPQKACTAVDAGNASWRCEQVSQPPAGAGSEPELVAVVLSKEQGSELASVAQQGLGLRWRPGWGQPVPVVAG
ncbi:hypothetical protein [Nocardia sp. NRRL S-836]|uniref:hypothetical protein n=1 Tax=Nocardia sp. NRRL S-836 TaxID=1519492 RepID=UPI0006AEA716|nr:hypothetical protein [Nocardia sp. NRRL S-836]KOV87181.1 hypothetical protein ADL03_07385 [Nocardia sp. NRRL S-836]